VPLAGPNWAELVQRIKFNDQSVVEELYRVFSSGVRFHLCRQLGPHDLEDKVHDTFLIVVQAVRRGDLREPERLMGLVHTVVQRQASASINHTGGSRSKSTPGP
jgi:RNA polymerase sigma-70 factor (ECF subfamily)